MEVVWLQILVNRTPLLYPVYSVIALFNPLGTIRLILSRKIRNNDFEFHRPLPGSRERDVDCDVDVCWFFLAFVSNFFWMIRFIPRLLGESRVPSYIKDC
jgi:hypothetical protein